MANILNSKKLIVSVFGILVVFILAMAGRDVELIKWVGGFVAGIVSTLNVAQGIADGMSRGATSASATVGHGNTNASGTSNNGGHK